MVRDGHSKKKSLIRIIIFVGDRINVFGVGAFENMEYKTLLGFFLGLVFLGELFVVV